MTARGREYTLDGSKPVGTFDGGIKLTLENKKTGEIKEQTSDTDYFDLTEMADWDMTLSFTLKEGDFTWGDFTKVTAYPEDQKPEGIDDQFHFAWEYSGPVTVEAKADGSASFLPTGGRDLPVLRCSHQRRYAGQTNWKHHPPLRILGRRDRGRFSPDSRKRQTHLRP